MGKLDSCLPRDLFCWSIASLLVFSASLQTDNYGYRPFLSRHIPTTRLLVLLANMDSDKNLTDAGFHDRLTRHSSAFSLSLSFRGSAKRGR